MSSSAWTFQKSNDVRDLGEDKAPWYAGWYEPDGRRRAKSFGAGFQGKKRAERFKNKVENELMSGTYQLQRQKLWTDFRAEYTRRVLDGLAVRTRDAAETSLAHFERIVKPVRVLAINTGHVDDFIAARRGEAGQKRGSRLSPASLNHDLRHVKAALRMAVEWGYLARLPRFHMQKLPKKLPRYVPGDHFAAIYAACDKARMPEGLPYPPADWWRGLIVMGYMTGWRISDMLGLRRDDLDLDGGVAVTRWVDNKGKRDERVKLHPVVVEHLRKLPGFTPTVFPWPHNVRTLYCELLRIQQAAQVKNAAGEDVPLHLPCHEEHEHTPYCHVYGFHDLRRAFATMNADKLTADALQTLMRHKSYQTTQVYINMARQIDEAVAKLHVPDVLRKAAAGGRPS